MSRSKLFAFFGSGAVILGSLTLGGCPQAADSTSVADETDSSVLSPGENVQPDAASALQNPVTIVPSDNTVPHDPIIDAGNNASGVVGDYDGDSALTEADINILSKSFGSNLPGGDLDANGRVDVQDLALLLSLVR